MNFLLNIYIYQGSTEDTQFGGSWEAMFELKETIDNYIASMQL